VLGHVTCPSGTLILTDMGYLRDWSGLEPPQRVPEEIADPELRASIAAGQDFTITGPDADQAARALGLQSFTYVYDIPRHGIPQIEERFTIKARGFNARLEREPNRVPHRERARRAASHGGGDFMINGVWSTAVGGIPTDHKLSVMGRKYDYGGVVGRRWADLAIVLDSDGPRAEGRRIGLIGVDWARILIADADALNKWVHNDSLDGQADVAFWGRDADEAGTRFGGEPLSDGTKGWWNLDVDDAKSRALALIHWLTESNRRIMVDYRPHSHHYLLMEQIRRDPDVFGVGKLELAGAHLLALETSWGDGIFPVFADEDPDGRSLEVRVGLGDEDRRAKTEAVLGRSR
jgi:hypothetical protein